TLVADIAAVARHLGMAAAAARAVAFGSLGVIAPKRERVIERPLRRGQVVARRERGQRLGALAMTGLADAHAQLGWRATGIVVATDAAFDARRGVIGVRGRRGALRVTVLAANRGAAPVRAMVLVIEVQVAFDQALAHALVHALLVAARA